MPRFFFDLEDGASAVDPEGVVLASAEVARTEALRALAEMARDVRPTHTERHLACTVRDADGGVYRLELSMRVLPLQ